jgi:hypothetical protein
MSSIPVTPLCVIIIKKNEFPFEGGIKRMDAYKYIDIATNFHSSFLR